MHGGSSLHHIRDETVSLVPNMVAAVSVFYTPDDGRMTPETCRESLPVKVVMVAWWILSSPY